MDFANFSSLQSRVKKLPKELQDAIFDKLLVVSLWPGKVFPHEEPNENGEYVDMDLKTYSAPHVDIRLALNSKLLPRADDLLYSQNTWVISTGPLSKLNFLRSHLPHGKQMMIKSLEVPFSYEDPTCAYWFMTRLQELVQHLKERPAAASVVEEAKMDHMNSQALWWNQCLEIWETKAECIAGLALQRLTLNFSTGYERAERRARILANYAGCIPFVHGVPPQLAIRGSAFQELENITVGKIKEENGVEELKFTRGALD